ncbi:MAG TPA: SAP domain-containing protein [Phycisphaerae bacterium]|nr:SAP domain-containing protein [Phycisphaerae bacterium]
MKMAEVQRIAKSKGVKSTLKSKEALVREIQRAENNRDCFNRGERDACGQETCAWRVDCK